MYLHSGVFLWWTCMIISHDGRPRGRREGGRERERLPSGLGKCVGKQLLSDSHLSNCFASCNVFTATYNQVRTFYARVLKYWVEPQCSLSGTVDYYYYYYDYVHCSVRVDFGAHLVWDRSVSKSNWLHGVISGPLHTRVPRAMTMNPWEPKRKCLKAAPNTPPNSSLVWSRVFKCSVKSYVTALQENLSIST